MSRDPYQVMDAAQRIEKKMHELLSILKGLSDAEADAEAAYKLAYARESKKAKANGATNPEADADGFLGSVDEWLEWNKAKNERMHKKMWFEALSSQLSMRQSELSFFKEEMNLTRTPHQGSSK